MERPDGRIRDIEPIQPDPQLQLSQGRATGIQITLVAIACMLIVSLMIYGLSPTTENITAPAPETQQTTGSAPPAAGPAAPQSGGNVAGGDNAAPKDERAPSQQQPAQQPVPQQQKPGAVEDDSTR